MGFYDDTSFGAMNKVVKKMEVAETRREILYVLFRWGVILFITICVAVLNVWNYNSFFLLLLMWPILLPFLHIYFKETKPSAFLVLKVLVLLVLGVYLCFMLIQQIEEKFVGPIKGILYFTIVPALYWSMRFFNLNANNNE